MLAAAKFRIGRDGKDCGPGIVRLPNVLGAHIARGKNGDERRRQTRLSPRSPSLASSRSTGTSRRDLESEFARNVDGLHCGSAGGANVVDDYRRAPFSRKPSMRCPIRVAFSALRTRSLQFAADHSDRYHDGIGAKVSPPMACGFTRAAEFHRKNTLTGQRAPLASKMVVRQST